MNDIESELQRLQAALLQSEKQLEAERAARKRAEATIRSCKDPTPVIRPSWMRVIKLVHEACMSLERLPLNLKSRRSSGWLLKMGHLVRRFKSLREIWDIFTAEEWFLSDIFPPAKPVYTAAPKLPFRAPVLLPYKSDVFNRLASAQPTTQ